MFKVLIVDDEQIIRYGLRSGFDWAANDCEVVGEASNGIEAVAKAKELSPDIIITDIRMPRYDGISFMKTLKESNSDAQIIVLSGYDDFKYAREAIESGAFSYLLKPVNLEVLTETISRIKLKIEERKKINTAVTTYNSIQTKELIMSMISNPSTSTKILEENPGFAQKNSGNFVIAVLSVDDTNTLNKMLPYISLQLKECIEYSISISENTIIRIPLTQTKYILVIFLSDNYSYDSAITSLKSLLESFRTNSNTTATIGISGIFRSLKLIATAYSQAEYALSFGPYFGKNAIIDYIQVTNDKFNICYMTEKDLENFSSLISNENYEKIESDLDSYFAELSKVPNASVDIVRNNILEIAIMLISKCAPNTDLMQLIFGRIVKPVEELSRLDSIKQIREWINNVLNGLFKSNSQISKYDLNDTVKRAIFYIISNYNKKLTVESVASVLYISPRHLMRCFKQQTGVTFNEYVTNYRMQKAIRLLETGEYSVFEVAQLVGYNDNRYFCKLFKKITGKNPGEF